MNSVSLGGALKKKRVSILYEYVGLLECFLVLNQYAVKGLGIADIQLSVLYLEVEQCNRNKSRMIATCPKQSPSPDNPSVLPHHVIYEAPAL